MLWPFVSFRGIDDPIGACSVHLIGGIWGQISVGLFAQPYTSGAHAGFLMGMTRLWLLIRSEMILIQTSSTGGGTYLLSVQLFSVVCLFFWGLIVTFPIMWIVNKLIPVRLSPEDEIKGCDIVEHYMGDEEEKILPQHITNAHISSIKFGGMNQMNFEINSNPYNNGSDKYREFDTLGKRKPYSNLGYEHEEPRTERQRTTSERL